MILLGKKRCVVHGNTRFRVRLGSGFTGGPVQQKYFKKGREADEFIEQVVDIRHREGQDAFRLTFDQRFEALKSFKKLAPYGVPLLTAVDTYVAEHCAPVMGKTVSGVINDFIKYCRRNNLKPRTITQYESDLSIYGETFGQSQMVGIVRDDIEEWLDEGEWSARTRRNKLTSLATFYNFGIDRGFCTVSPVERIKRPKVDDEPIGLLTPDQSQALLDRTQKVRPELIPGVSIAIFAGPRRSELCALDWSEVHIDDREIEIKASKAKTRQRRVITINDALARWLAICKPGQGPVTVTTNADVWGKWIRELALAAGIKEWPKNALRHGFGSYFFAQCKDENRVAAEMGNSPKMVHRHYRAMVKAADCQRFWAIAPAENPPPRQAS